MKSWKMFVLLFVCLVGFNISSNCLADIEEINGQYSIGLYDQYLQQWSGEILDDRLSGQGEVNFDLPHDFYAGVWFAGHAGDSQRYNGNEIDLNVGWVGEINEFLIEPKLSYRNLVPILEIGREGNILAPSIKVSKKYSYEDWEIKPFGRLEIEIPDGEDRELDFEWEKFYSFGVENSTALSAWTVHLTPYITYDSRPYDMEGVIIFFQSVSATYVVNDYILCPSLLLSYPFSEDSGMEMQKVIGFSITKKY